jgi:3-dehydrosphinganine reductase
MSKTALITGGSSGLGLAFAKILGKQGFSILILARNQDKIQLAINELNRLSIKSEGFVCDVSDDAELKQTSEIIKSRFGQIDFLILNAGTVTVKLLSDYTGVDEIKKDLDTDLFGMIGSAYYFLPMLKEGSKVLMTSSGFGLVGAAGYSVYCAAKAGIVNFAESLRRELLHLKINVYVACPGDMDTPQFRHEMESQPLWMKSDSPRKVVPVDCAAKRILNKCKGKYNFLVISGSDVKLLYYVTKLFPRKWRDYLLDNMLPRPK